MIPVNDVLNFLMAVPKSYLDVPEGSGVQYVCDKNGERIGHIHWRMKEIVVYDDYEHAVHVCDSIQRSTAKKVIRVNHPDIDKEVFDQVEKIKQDPDWISEDVEEALYGEPVITEPEHIIPHVPGEDDQAPF